MRAAFRLASLSLALALTCSVLPTTSGVSGQEPGSDEPKTDVDDDSATVGESASTDEGPERIELSIDQAIAIALAFNLNVKIEELSRNRTREDATIAAAVFDPVFSTSYTHQKFRQPTVDTLSGLGNITATTVNPSVNQNGNFGFSGLLPTGMTWSLTANDNRSNVPDSAFFGFNPQNRTLIRAEFTQPLLKNFGFDTNLADLRQARNSDLIAFHRLGRLLETTLTEVHDAYWNLSFRAKDLEVKLEQLREAEELLEINEQKVRVGSAKRIDIVDAEANIETQKSGIIEAENELERARDTLIDLLNYRSALRSRDHLPAGSVPLYVELIVIPTSPLEADPFEVDRDTAIADALARRQDLRQAELQLTNAELELQRRRNQRLPEFNLTGSWNQSGLEENIGNSIDGIGSGRFYDWSVGFTIEYPLGNRRERSLYLQSRNDVDAQRYTVEQLRNSIVLEVTQAVRDIQSTLQRVQTTRAASRLRAEQLQGEQERLKVGASTSYQVLQVQNDLLEAKVEEVRALVDYRIAITTLESATGTILPDELLPEYE